MENPFVYFSGMKDPRVDRTKRHMLDDIIAITMMAAICGYVSWEQVETYGKAKIGWLQTFLKLPCGIPSHDTFCRVMSLLDPDELQKRFFEWTKAVAKITEGELISIDGKTIRGSANKKEGTITHLVSAWATKNNIALGQVKTDAKSNEITAIPELLRLLVLKGCIVTIDAMGCQKHIAQTIVEKEADYILALKGNQANLFEQTKDSFRFLQAFSTDTDVDINGDRIETRECMVLTDLSMIEKKEEWFGLKSVVKVESERIFKSSGKIEKQTRYYISSLIESAAFFNHSIRSHWGIENKLHWVLDVAFDEDKMRKRIGHSAQNFSVASRIALNLLRNETSFKKSIPLKQTKASLDDEYMKKVLNF
jgi:predicted transposase YbfD/YdcC